MSAATDTAFDDPARVLSALESATRDLTEAAELAAALEFARERHAGQTRRDPSVPYWVHLARVTARLAQWGARGPLLVAGLLHDTLEDTATDRTDLRRRFGAEAADLVVWVTTPARGEAEHYRRLARTGPWPARLLKLADRTDNLTSALVELRRRPTSRERHFCARYLERGRHQTDPLLAGAAPLVSRDYRRARAGLRRGLAEAAR